MCVGGRMDGRGWVQERRGHGTPVLCATNTPYAPTYPPTHSLTHSHTHSTIHGNGQLEANGVFAESQVQYLEATCCPADPPMPTDPMHVPGAHTPTHPHIYTPT